MAPRAFSKFERSPSIDRQSCRHQHIVDKRRMIGRPSQITPRRLATPVGNERMGHARDRSGVVSIGGREQPLRDAEN
jgi:hypothetical protein